MKFVAVIQYHNHNRMPEVTPAHRQYLAELKAQGRLLSAGRFTDQSGALIIYEAASEEELCELISADPFSRSDIFNEIAIKEWNQVY